MGWKSKSEKIALLGSWNTTGPILDVNRYFGWIFWLWGACKTGWWYSLRGKRRPYRGQKACFLDQKEGGVRYPVKILCSPRILIWNRSWAIQWLVFWLQSSLGPYFIKRDWVIFSYLLPIISAIRKKHECNNHYKSKTVSSLQMTANSPLRVTNVYLQWLGQPWPQRS